MKTTAQTQFGDFQTPIDLACQVTQFLSTNGVSPSAVIEPTCGVGNFLVASMRTFGGGIPYYGFDINPDHVDTARDALVGQGWRALRVGVREFLRQGLACFFPLSS